MSRRPRGLWAAVRPLDPVRSIKAKLGLLVAASVVAGATLTWYGVVVLQWSWFVTIPLAVLVALALTQVLAHGMTEPLRRMTAAAGLMAAGLPAPPVPATGRDEVGRLARAFSAMAADLAAAEGQRRELLANVAHELRTPVTALRAQLENVVDGVHLADAAVHAELLARTEHLSRLVDDLLDLARADAGADPPVRATVPVRPLVADVVAEVGPARPGPALVNRVPAGLVVRADPARLRQALTNLVDNAARHAATRVEVRGVRTSAATVLEIVDDGPGIPPDERETVFRRFHSGAPAAVATGGTGLGLAIARWAVLLHGGRLAVADSSAGCVMRLELPDVPST
ncbi:MAG: sensor histidine kinase [Kineosporiaceae bacterium]